MSNALETIGLGRRYGRTWALRDCALALPTGRVAALIGPNGAGKTTLLHLIVGLLQPTVGEIKIFGQRPSTQPEAALAHISFVAQDQPLYRNFTVEEMLRLGRELNLRWDDRLAHARIQKLGIPLERRTGKLSGGQRAQVALVLALAKRPDLLLLDEPLATLDPLARREFLSTLMDAVAESGLTVLLSSHIIGELERVCDHLIMLSASQVQLTGDISELVQAHKRLVGPRQSEEHIASLHTVIEASHTARQTTLFVRTSGPIFGATWDIQAVSLEDIALAYLSQQKTGQAQSPASRGKKELGVVE